MEPSGEKAFYSHNRTATGGLVSCDFTGGYGPEEYMVHRAAPGKYKIEAMPGKEGEVWVYLGLYGIYRSSDSGENFTRLATVGGNSGDLPESKTRHSKMPVEKFSLPAIPSFNLVVVTSGNVVTLNLSASTPRPLALVISIKLFPSQKATRHSFGRRTP